MKRFFSLILVLVLIFAVVSCGGKKKKEEKPAYEEQVTKEVSAEEGGTVESKDGKTSIEVPAGALDSNTTITMTIYDAKGYTGTEGQKVVSKVVEFEPSGTVFKKPVIITMTAEENVEGKVFSAAVYREEKGEWSYSEHGAYAVLAGKDAAGDPIMQSAAGDPIMLNAAGDPIMMSAAGDPIMMSAAGDPIMLASAGDPIMTNAAGDPIMNAAAGDPIMMTTGHFTAYTFITLEPAEPVEEPDDNDDIDMSDIEISDNDEDEISEGDEDEIAEGDEDIDISDIEISEDDDEIPDEDEDEDIDTAPAEPPVYSKVLCTGQIHCSDGESIIDCPAEGEDFYGQDSQFVAKKSCVPHKYTKVVPGDTAEGGDVTAAFNQVVDENTGLTWLLLNEEVNMTAALERCENLEYGGHDDWRLPEAKEFLSISDHGRREPSVNSFYFGDLSSYYWTNTPAVSFGYEDELMLYSAGSAMIFTSAGSYSSSSNTLVCVRGEKYGEIGEYTSQTLNGDEVVSDSSTDLMWQKTAVSNKTWNEALKYCNDLEYAGKSDWRLPNKNELVTLIDYSKSAPASSFPEMSSDTFWTSTFETEYGGSSGSITVAFGNARLDKDSSTMTLSVRCVRSGLDPLTSGVPECSETRIAPCKDASTGYLWSAPTTLSNSYNGLMWQDDAVRCRGLKSGGVSQWRIPTIDELRTLLSSSDKLKTGGECKVTGACSDYFSETCFQEGMCTGGSGEGFESSLHDYGYYVSGTFSGQVAESEENSYSWAVDLTTGSIVSVYSESGRNETRCIYDESLPDVSFPYTDSANHLVWSSMSKSYDEWYEAAKYCSELVEGGSNNWRVPTMEELKTLRQNCSGDSCLPTATGKYSVFGDLDSLWSSTMEAGDNSGELTTYMDFMTASQVVISPDSYSNVKTRCVRSTDDAETVTELEFPFEIGDLIWSKVSEEEHYGSESVAQYCESLNAEGYGGRTDWTLPGTNDLVALIKKSVCSNKSTFLSENSATCDKYSFEGYSIFDDMVQLAASDGYIDFARGSMYKSSYSYGFVRCVVVLPDSGS